MRCPKCESRTRVSDSRPQDSGEVYRMRVCPKCRYRFITFERLAEFPVQGDGKPGGKRIAHRDLMEREAT